MKNLPRNLLLSVSSYANKPNRKKKQLKKSQKFKIKIASSYLVINKQTDLFIILNTTTNQLIGMWRFFHTDYFPRKFYDDWRGKKNQSKHFREYYFDCVQLCKNKIITRYTCSLIFFLNHIGSGLGVFISASSFMLFNVSKYHVNMLIIPIFKSVVIKLSYMYRY